MREVCNILHLCFFLPRAKKMSCNVEQNDAKESILFSARKYKSQVRKTQGKCNETLFLSLPDKIFSLSSINSPSHVLEVKAMNHDIIFTLLSEEDVFLRVFTILCSIVIIHERSPLSGSSNWSHDDAVRLCHVFFYRLTLQYNADIV